MSTSASVVDTTVDETKTIRFLDQTEAQNIDIELMSTLAFSIDQLMELAGLSCATSIQKTYSTSDYSRILVICGPGNNGGDGLVASRHLSHFGYDPTIVLPKESKKQLYLNLQEQCRQLNIPILNEIPNETVVQSEFDLMIDSIFGFSFDATGTIRSPYDHVLQVMKNSQQATPIVSIDIPSGWDVEKGDVLDIGIEPDMLISLTAPKLCAKHFKGRYHMLGGRFVPHSVRDKYQLNLPAYPGSDQCVQLSGPSSAL